MRFASLLGFALAAFSFGCGGGDSPSGSGGSGGGGGASSSSTPASSTSTGAAGGGPCPAIEAQLHDVADQARTQTQSLGAVVAVVTPACGVLTAASGDSTASEPMRSDDLVRIGSITKSFVAAAALLERDAGALTLDDPLEMWVPGFPSGDAITIRMLLQQTTGIFDYTGDQGFQDALVQDPGRTWQPQELVDFAAQHPLAFTPGTAWQYSNTNYILAGMVLEAASGKSLAELLRTKVIDPTALASTTFGGAEPNQGHLAHGYIEGIDETNAIDPSILWAAGAIVSQPADVATWSRQLFGGHVLPASSLDDMLTVVDTGTPGWGYGLGVLVMDASFAGAAADGHDGAFPGYLSWTAYFPATDSAFACTVNSYPADLSSLNFVIGRMASVIGGAP